MTSSLQFSQIAPFVKDIQSLAKKYPSLPEDLETTKTHAIVPYHLQAIDSQSIFRIPGFSTPTLEIYKIKKFTCRSLKGKGARSGIRVIYAFHPEDKRVVFLEIYFKKKESTDANVARIEEYLASSSYR